MQSFDKKKTKCDILIIKKKLPYPFYLKARQDEIVVQNIILPFGAKESKLWSIPEGVPPDIRGTFKKPDFNQIYVILFLK